MHCGRYVIEPRWCRCTHTHKLSASLAPRSASRALCQSPAVSPRHVVTPLRQASDRHIMSLLHSRNPVAVKIVRRGQ